MATNKNSYNIPLNNSTTYSGADINAFVYRDLTQLALGNKGNSKISKRDGTVTTKESTSNIASSSSFTGVESGSVARGQFNPQNGIYQKTQPTNRVDSEYINNASSRASNTSNEGLDERFVSGLGIDSIVTELGSLHSLNYSTFREKIAVRTLGRTHARGYTRGQRTIAGTMIFNVLQSHELLRFANSAEDNYYAMLDQIEPFNMILLFSNEYGSLSVLHLFNIEIASESQGMSIDQLILNNTMNFYAQDLLPMEEVGNAFYSTSEMLNAAVADARFQSFINEMQSNKLTGLKSLDSSLSGGSASDTRIQKLLKRSRGLF